ncbi:hypothetical protein HU200_013716 [Digitaria exilis]|uniref:Uncharacterized protein n=1 Tax=Digitaria exilis TaxID=1010633 RepID=A0A835FCS0_9POAL|nr:hypothetical protein HU200_013716 [Digitaria exilis]
MAATMVEEVGVVGLEKKNAGERKEERPVYCTNRALLSFSILSLSLPSFLHAHSPPASSPALHLLASLCVAASPSPGGGGGARGGDEEDEGRRSSIRFEFMGNELEIRHDRLLSSSVGSAGELHHSQPPNRSLSLSLSLSLSPLLCCARFGVRETMRDPRCRGKSAIPTLKRGVAHPSATNLRVTIKRKNHNNGDYMSKAAGKLQSSGVFSSPLSIDLHVVDCLAQIHSTEGMPYCRPGQEPSICCQVAVLQSSPEKR